MCHIYLTNSRYGLEYKKFSFICSSKGQGLYRRVGNIIIYPRRFDTGLRSANGKRERIRERTNNMSNLFEIVIQTSYSN